MINFNTKILFLSIIFLLDLVLAKSNGWITNSVEVHIINALPPNSKPLALHCKSGDDDLGNKTIPMHDEFDIYFNEKLFGGTLFFCHFWWNSKTIVFDVYNNHVSKNCGVKDIVTDECYWRVQEDGFYFNGHRDPIDRYVKKYDW
ncbi:hypothetical protein R3W88_023582 [Solanum pinnatisectum]|uniref:S-protein homolog n=1 Tax=Solanum pinnatisectum TaxID=50273 RepID=A0AAV9M120_9SOLN|nr:hypothetical protein R3W88_023582 [Solanum pinnatisectum]